MNNKLKEKIRGFLGIDFKGRLFINILDKIETQEILNDEKQRYCPPHKIPHVIKGQVCDEPCHIHTSKWRDYHHILFCKILKCPNYDDMKEARKKYGESKH